MVSLPPVDTASPKAVVLGARALRNTALVEPVREVHADNDVYDGTVARTGAVKAVLLVVSRPPGSCAWRTYQENAQSAHLIRPREPKGPGLRLEARAIENVKPRSPSRLWVADITYVHTRKRFVYTVCVTDVYSRRIRLGEHYRTRCARQAPAPAITESGHCVCAENHRACAPRGPWISVSKPCL